jgi:hypothetical protein
VVTSAIATNQPFRDDSLPDDIQKSKLSIRQNGARPIINEKDVKDDSLSLGQMETRNVDWCPEELDQRPTRD